MPQEFAVDPKMSSKDKGDLLMQLAEFRLSRQHRRRDYEWKVSLGVWAALAWALVTIKQRPPGRELAYILIATVVMHLFFWVMPLARRNRHDMQMAFFFADRAAALVVDSGIEIKDPPERKSTAPERWKRIVFWLREGMAAISKDAWSGLFPVLVSTVLALAVWLLLGSNLLETPSPQARSTSRTMTITITHAEAPALRRPRSAEPNPTRTSAP